MGGTMVDGTQLYHDAIKRIQQLEKLNSQLAAEVDAQRQREQSLSAAYLRLRQLIGREAFDTPHGPTGEQVWTVTELALAKIVAEVDRMRPVITAVHGYCESDQHGWDNPATLRVVRDAYSTYEAAQREG